MQKTSYFKTYQVGCRCAFLGHLLTFSEVFQIYWHENTGEMADSVMASNTSISFSRTHGETIYSKTRRMIVVARLSRHCLCV